MLENFLCLPLFLCFSVVEQNTCKKLQIPHIFGDHMVIQRDKPIRMWGSAEPEATVQVRLAELHGIIKANQHGTWSLELEALPANAEGTTLSVTSNSETIEYQDVIIGDVWILGGQSNMEDELENVYHGDMEVASANHPNIRLMTIPQEASPQPLSNFARINEYNSWTGRYEQKGGWFRCTPETVHRFSAIGYIFGRRLHLVSGIPIGLIDTAWGGTTVEAWTSRDMLKTVDGARPLLAEWDAKIEDYDAEASLQERIDHWKEDTERRKKEGKSSNPKPTEPGQDPASDRNNPGASFNGMIVPYADFNLRGAIFNQGYNNALGDARPKLYARVFKAMIQDWRCVFQNEAMPFGIISLTAGGNPQIYQNFEISMIDAGPFIREGQYKAWQELENVGFAPAYDQQVPWYHPHKKVELGERIARWALHTQYGQTQLGWQPAICTELENRGNHLILTFDRAVRVHDGRPFEGFAIAGEDQHFYPAKAEFVVVGQDEHGRDRLDQQKLKIWSPVVLEPEAVRYAWARNPIGNAVNSQHHERIIPIPSFRTDDWDWPEAPFDAAGLDAKNAHNHQLHQMRQQAEVWIKKRIIEEAKEILKATEGSSK